jgi:malate synthase
MAAFVPNRKDPAMNGQAMDRVRQDKEREAAQGFDGTWVAHPDIVAVARAAFDAALRDQPHPILRASPALDIPGSALYDVRIPGGRVTEQGLRDNLAVGLRYLAAWLCGTGAVVLANKMEDTATAEIARAQVWQWIARRTPFATGNDITAEVVRGMLDAELEALRAAKGDAAVRAGRFDEARDLLLELVVDRSFAPFLTLAGAPLLEPLVLAA